MISLTMTFGTARHDALRWSFCFAVAIAAHGAAALAFLLNPSPDSDFGAGAPVVMIELPEAPAAFATPPSDLAPGPTEPESEQTPPPKEETKPPEEWVRRRAGSKRYSRLLLLRRCYAERNFQWRLRFGRRAKAIFRNWPGW